MIQIVGKMQDGKPVIFPEPIDKPVEVDDVLLNEDGEYLRVIHNGQRFSSVVIDEPVLHDFQKEIIDYVDTIDSLLMDTGRQ